MTHVCCYSAIQSYPADFFYDCFGRNRAQWRTFSIYAFDGPNLKGVSLEQLLAMSDEQLDSNVRPYLTSRRWVRDRYLEWFNGTAENRPLWHSRVLGEFPSESTNALIPLCALETARKPAVDSGRRDDRDRHCRAR